MESAFPFPFGLFFLFLDGLPNEWLCFFSGSKIITIVSNNPMHAHDVRKLTRPRQSFSIGSFTKQFNYASDCVPLNYGALGTFGEHLEKLKL